MYFQSQTLSRLAAAHRGAVRALQTFVSHAPLQPKVGHGLPPMYQELSALIRQLSLLAAQLHIGGEDLTDEVKAKEDEGRKVGDPLASTLHVLLILQSLTQNSPSELSLPFSIPPIHCRNLLIFLSVVYVKPVFFLLGEKLENN